MQHFPLRSSGRRILNYLDDWLILARSLDTLISHIDSLLIHLESLRLCLNMQRAFSLSRDRVGMRARLSRDRVGDETLPLVRSHGDESLPLVRSRGDEIPPLARSSRGQLSSLRLFRQGSSVQLKVFQRLPDSRWRIQRYYIRDYYTCARCSYGWNLESRERRGLRDVCASQPHRSSDATQISSAGEFPCAR